MGVLSVCVLTTLLVSAVASTGQTGFSTKIYPAADDRVLRVADFNGDGKPDLFGYAVGLGSGDVYLNDGSGGFKAPVALPFANGSPVLASIADMNGDGAPDIVVCDAGFFREGESTTLVIYLNDGAGGFTISQSMALPHACEGMVVGDVNADGHQDVVISSSANAGQATSFPNNNIFMTFFGNGGGQVNTPVIQQNVYLDSPDSSNDFTNCQALDITGGDFFLDGRYSLIVNTRCIPAGSTTAAIFGTTFLGHGNGTGNFSFAFSHKGYEDLTDGQTVDVNQDGKPDATYYSVTGQPTSNLYYVENMGGSFAYNQLTKDVEGGGAPVPVNFAGDTVTDLTGDGIRDVASIFATKVQTSMDYRVTPYISILAGSKSGTFVESQHWLVDANATSVGDLASADFNGDGKPDLATVVMDGESPNQTMSLYVYTNMQGQNVPCTTPTAANTNVICSPAKGATTTSPVTVTAASNVSGFTLNRLYLDDVSVYQMTSQTVNTPIVAASGTHDLVLVSYDNTGQAFAYATTFTVGAGSCAPSSAGVRVCQPASGAATSSPVTFTAGVLAQAGNITALRIYVDNAALYTAINPGRTTTYQASQSVPVNAGSHRLVVVGYESTGAAVSFAENFTVNANPNCYPASAGAMICSPVKGEAASSPVQVNVGATAASGYITAIGIYVDNKEVNVQPDARNLKSFSEDVPVALTTGVHNLVVVGYQSTGGYVTTGEMVTIQ